jgi:hypothetical protein
MILQAKGSRVPELAIGQLESNRGTRIADCGSGSGPLLTFLACSSARLSALRAVREPLVERFVSDDEAESLRGGGFLRSL